MNKDTYIANTNLFIHLIALYLNKKTIDLTIDEETFVFFAKLAKGHSLTALLYQVLKETKVIVNKEQFKKLEDRYLLNVKKDVMYQAERKKIYAYLNENKVDFLPLKGIVIKDYWPDPSSREFVDNDILFPDDKSKIVREFFINNDYAVEHYKKSNHDVYYKKPFIIFEMHRDLFIDTGNTSKLAPYFADYLRRSFAKKEYEHEVSDEDFYIYFTTHTYKHFYNAGCGIRTLVDYYCFLKKKTNLDFNYINQELEKIDLVDFSNQIKTLAIKTFDEEPLTDNEKEILLYIVSSGTYGVLKNNVEKGIKKKGKFGYLMSRIFPPASFYKNAYPWAYKTKVLIPVAWLIRLFKIIFKSPKKAAKEIKMISKAKKED